MPDDNTCLWCAGSDAEPADSDDAEMLLCREHLAEYEGTSLAGLDQRDAGERADMTDLGYFDR
jgi:hypothetical protein